MSEVEESGEGRQKRTLGCIATCMFFTAGVGGVACSTRSASLPVLLRIDSIEPFPVPPQARQGQTHKYAAEVASDEDDERCADVERRA